MVNDNTNGMSTTDAEEYTQALGQVVSGGYRQVALGVRLGVPTALGISTAEWVERRLGGYVRMSVEDRREAAAELVSEGMTQRETAEVLGVSPGTVNEDLKPPVQNRTEGPDSMPEAVQNRTPAAELFIDAEAVDETPELEPEPEPLADAKWQGDKGVLINTGEDDWPTPPHIIGAAAAALGAIDLDPCASTAGRVPATTRYTVADDGLAHPWVGRVYMNPPYGRAIGAWIERLTQSYGDGSVTAFVALVPARTDTAWFQHLDNCRLCFIRGRLTFGDAEQGAPFPSVAAYMGPDADAFSAAFGQLGPIWERVDR